MIKRLLLTILLAIPSYAAISANSVWEFQPSVGSDTNGGGFAIGVGTKTVTAATDLAVDASLNTKVTSGTHNFVAGDVGKYLSVTAGTGWTQGYYRIASTASNAATLDRSPAAVNTTAGTYDLYDGIDYSDKGATSQVNIENSSITVSCATNTLTFTAGHTTVATEVGNMVNLTATSGVTAGIYEITAVSVAAPPSGTWTLTGAASACTSGPNTGVVGKMGGSLASLSGVFPTGGGAVGSNKIWFKSTGNQTTTATITLSTAVTVSNTAPFTSLLGYTTTRGDNGQATIKQSSGTGYSLLTTSGNGWILKNLIFDGNAGATVGGINNSGSANLVVQNCKFTNWKGSAVTAGAAMTILDSEFTAASSALHVINHTAGSLQFMRNNVHDNTLTSGALSSSAGVSFLIAENLFTKNTGTNVDSIAVSCASSQFCMIDHNTIDQSGRDNIRLATWSSGYIRNNILTAPAQTTSGGANLDFSAGAGEAYNIVWDGNAYWVGSGSSPVNFINNADEGVTNPVNGSSPNRTVFDVILTGSPYTNSAGNDYSLNNTAGAGAAAKGAGVPGTWLGGSSTGHFDMGAVQTASSGAVAGTVASACVN